MKILEDYKKIAHELLFEVDDEKMIKYKDEDGESKEMKAGSAKTMPADHPAKQAWDKMQDSGDGSDDKEAPSDKKLGKGDFDRDGGDEPKGDSSTASEKNELEAKYDIKIPNGPLDKEDTEDEAALNIADAIAKKYDVSAEYASERASEEITNSESYLEFAKTIESDMEEMAEDGEQQRYDEPMFDDDGMRNLRNKDSDDDSEKTPFYSTTQGIIYKNGDNLPKGTDEKTKIKDIDEDAIDDFFDSAADYFAEKNDITMGAMADMKDDIIRYSDDLGDLADSIKSAAEEAKEEGGYERYGESVKVEGLNERAWTPAQEKAVKELNKKHQKLIAKKGIEPYSYEASQLWTSGGFKKEMRKIFGKDVKEGVNEPKNKLFLKEQLERFGGGKY